MSETLLIVFCSIGVLLCFLGIRHEGQKFGYGEGCSDGYLMAMKDICDGHLKIENESFIFDDDNVRFYDADGPLYVLEWDKLEFVTD